MRFAKRARRRLLGLGVASLLLAGCHAVCGPEHSAAIRADDPYQWLEDASNAQTKQWLSDQERKSHDYFQNESERDALKKKLAPLFSRTEVSPPIVTMRGSYFERRITGRNRPEVRLIGRDGERTVLDANEWDDNVALGSWWPSTDGEWVAYSRHPNGADEGELRVLNVAKDEDLSEHITWASYADLAWVPSGKGFYYLHIATSTALPEAERPGLADIRFHKLGTPAWRDPVVFEATNDASVYLIPHVSEDGQWLIVHRQRGWSADEVFVHDRSHPESGFVMLYQSTSSVPSVIESGELFFVLTFDDAPNGRVLTLSTKSVSLASPRTVFSWWPAVPERRDTVLEELHIFGRRLVILSHQRGGHSIDIGSSSGVMEDHVGLPTVGLIRDLRGREDDLTFFFSLQSYATPPAVYQASARSGEAHAWRPQEFAVYRSTFVTETVSYRSKDGTEIPMVLVRAAGPKVPRPTILRVYGGFNTPMLPYFTESLLPWLQMGGALAVPSLRGGGDLGEAWHRAGMLDQKQHTFDDAIAAAEFLIKQGYTTAPQLAIEGASNGGLTAAAVVTQRPDLFGAAVIKNPLTDMLRFDRLGEGKAWVPEYGSPQDARQARTLLGYSPYHHVRKGAAYPSVLMLSAEADDRVAPMHARKFAAALQAATSSGKPVVFRSLTHTGHGGAGRKDASVEEWTERLLFLRRELIERVQRSEEKRSLPANTVP